MNKAKHTSITMKFLACFDCKKYILFLHWISLKDKKTYMHTQVYVIVTSPFTPMSDLACYRDEIHQHQGYQTCFQDSVLGENKNSG